VPAPPFKQTLTRPGRMARAARRAAAGSLPAARARMAAGAHRTARPCGRRV